jgi:L-fuculokinase
MTQSIPTIAIFDIGKTNKKLFLFDEEYRIVYEKMEQLPQTIDEDGEPCEDINLITTWVKESWAEVLAKPEFDIQALNFSTYGASLVHLDEHKKLATPLYNYMKPFPEDLKNEFYQKYGGEEEFSIKTASPVLGNLNSGMQMILLKYRKPELYKKIKYTLHLPQYLHWLITNKRRTDITSVGCHTNLWNFSNKKYHEWVELEGFSEKFAKIKVYDEITNIEVNGKKIVVGNGLHDSSAALIPYQANFDESFILLSTGTWCISFNPFNTSPLNAEELQYDCLNYLHYRGKSIKASRLFAGNEHEQQAKNIADYFQKDENYYLTVRYDSAMIDDLQMRNRPVDFAEKGKQSVMQRFVFGQRDLRNFTSFEEAYHQLMLDIMSQQLISTQLVQTGGIVKTLFVDGGFSKNEIFMTLLAKAFPKTEVFAATISQASAIGAAMAIHRRWNNKKGVSNFIALKKY